MFRLEFDACRNEMELLPPGAQLNEKQQEFEKCKDKYEKWKCDVSIKMKFLDENQVEIIFNANDRFIFVFEFRPK